jgi:hypothetical protein
MLSHTVLGVCVNETEAYNSHSSGVASDNVAHSMSIQVPREQFTRSNDDDIGSCYSILPKLVRYALTV